MARRSILPCAVVCLLAFAPASRAETVSLEAALDNTLYEDVDGSLSNGTGDHMFAGRTQFGAVRRAVVVFPIQQQIPPGSIVTSVRLGLHMSRTIVGPQPVALHRVLKAWGEGASDPIGNEGAGAPSAAGDATWIHTMFDTAFWDAPGGDFVETASATIGVSAVGDYVWGSTPELVADVQAWVDGTEPNYGWILIGNEETSPTAKRFDTHDNPDPAVRPRLTVEFTPPAGSSVALDCSCLATCPGSEIVALISGTNDSDVDELLRFSLTDPAPIPVLSTTVPPGDFEIRRLVRFPPTAPPVCPVDVVFTAALDSDAGPVEATCAAELIELTE